MREGVGGEVITSTKHPNSTSTTFPTSKEHLSSEEGGGEDVGFNKENPWQLSWRERSRTALAGGARCWTLLKNRGTLPPQPPQIHDDQRSVFGGAGRSRVGGPLTRRQVQEVAGREAKCAGVQVCPRRLQPCISVVCSGGRWTPRVTGFHKVSHGDSDSPESLEGHFKVSSALRHGACLQVLLRFVPGPILHAHHHVVVLQDTLKCDCFYDLIV